MYIDHIIIQKTNHFLWHYNSYNVYKKILELNSKIVKALDEYHGLFKKYDRTYKKLNPNIKLEHSYKSQNIIKSFLLWLTKNHLMKYLNR